MVKTCYGEVKILVLKNNPSAQRTVPSNDGAVALHSRIAADFHAKYQSSSSFRERFALWRTSIFELVDASGEVLDAGCGSGVLSLLACEHAHSVFAFDGSAEMIALAKGSAERQAMSNVKFCVAMLCDPSIIATRSFDLILCSSVLEYVEDYWRAFDWLAGALKPGGTILFSMPNGASLYRRAERLAFRLTGRPAYYAHVRNVPTLGEVRAGLARRGFEVRSCQYYAAAPLLSPLARAIGRADLADNLFVIACGLKA